MLFFDPWQVLHSDDRYFPYSISPPSEMRGITENTRIPNKLSEPALNRCFIQNYLEAIKYCDDFITGDEQFSIKLSSCVIIFRNPNHTGAVF